MLRGKGETDMVGSMAGGGVGSGWQSLAVVDQIPAVEGKRSATMTGKLDDRDGGRPCPILSNEDSCRGLSEIPCPIVRILSRGFQGLP